MLKVSTIYDQWFSTMTLYLREHWLPPGDVTPFVHQHRLGESERSPSGGRHCLERLGSRHSESLECCVQLIS